MQDAVGLIGKELIIDKVTYTVTNIQFVPGSNVLYITISDNKVFINYPINSLLPYLIAQIKL